MLASILPGIRDVRTPLTAGYIWLAFGWMIFGGLIPGDMGSTSERLAYLVDFGSFLGAAAALTVISFAAYTLGGLLTFSAGSRPVAAIASRIGTKFKIGTSDSTASQYYRLVEVERERVRRKGTTIGKDPRPDPADTAAALAQIDHQRDVSHLRHHLLVANTELYGEYDRLMAEAEFRINIATPILALATVLAIDVAWWWFLVGLCTAGGLLVRGVVRLAQARVTIMNAAVNKVFKHPAVDIADQFEKTGQAEEILVW